MQKIDTSNELYNYLIKLENVDSENNYYKYLDVLLKTYNKYKKNFYYFEDFIKNEFLFNLNVIYEQSLEKIDFTNSEPAIRTFIFTALKWYCLNEMNAKKIIQCPLETICLTDDETKEKINEINLNSKKLSNKVKQTMNNNFVDKLEILDFSKFILNIIKNTKDLNDLEKKIIIDYIKNNIPIYKIAKKYNLKERNTYNIVDKIKQIIFGIMKKLDNFEI